MQTNVKAIVVEVPVNGLCVGSATPISADTENLRKSGYKVRVYHCREYECPVSTEHKLLASRKEYQSWIEDVKRANLEVFLTHKLSSRGGFTIVEIRTPDGTELKGKYNTPKGKQFNRKLGLKVAINRALATGGN